MRNQFYKRSRSFVLVPGSTKIDGGSEVYFSTYCELLLKAMVHMKENYSSIAFPLIIQYW